MLRDYGIEVTAAKNILSKFVGYKGYGFDGPQSSYTRASIRGLLSHVPFVHPHHKESSLQRLPRTLSILERRILT